MNLSYSEEQNLLRDSVRRYVARRPANPTRCEATLWQDMADMGWLALSLPETHGGLGGTAVDVTILMEALGRGPVPSPYVGTVLLAGGTIAVLGNARQQATWLPLLARGELLLGFAHDEAPASSADEHAPTRATALAQGWLLEGCKGWVLDAPSADAFVVSAHLPAGGVGAFLVSNQAVGLSRSDVDTVDGRQASRIRLRQVRLEPDAWLGDGSLADATDALEAIVDRANAALAAEMLGAMETMLALTIEHTRTRHQFGQPLSSHQVLRHRMVRMAVACEEARSMVLLAALKADAAPVERARAVSSAKVKVAASARYVAEQAIHLHGAMGMSDEVVLGACLRRVMACEAVLGTPARHLERYARWPAAAPVN